MKVRHTITTNPRLRSLRQIAQIDSEDMVKMTEAVDREFRKGEVALFASQGSMGKKGPWKPLEPGYAAWKRRHFPGRKIMVLTGQLRRSLTQKNAPDHVAVYSVKKPSISVGTLDPVAAYHIRDPRNPIRSGMPDRDTLAVSEKTEQLMLEAVRAYLTKKLERIARILLAGASAMRARGVS